MTDEVNPKPTFAYSVEESIWPDGKRLTLLAHIGRHKFYITGKFVPRDSDISITRSELMDIGWEIMDIVKTMGWVKQ